MNKTTIRRFRVGDELALREVYRPAIHELAAADYTRDQIDAWAPEDFDRSRWAGRMRGIDPFVAEQDDEIVGYAEVQADGYIDHFFVSPRVARQGVGSILMERLHEDAHARCIDSLYANVSITARPFFEKWGFLAETEQSASIDGIDLKNFRMIKSFPR